MKLVLSNCFRKHLHFMSPDWWVLLSHSLSIDSGTAWPTAFIVLGEWRLLTWHVQRLGSVVQRYWKARARHTTRSSEESYLLLTCHRGVCQIRSSSLFPSGPSDLCPSFLGQQSKRSSGPSRVQKTQSALLLGLNFRLWNESLEVDEQLWCKQTVWIGYDRSFLSESCALGSGRATVGVSSAS